jgi:anaerobic C4-dicarboxylate transporter
MIKLKIIFLLVFIVLLAIVAYQQHQIVENQKTQMKQQFHSDLITLASLFGENGIKRVFSKTAPNDLSDREIFATALLLQRCVTAYWIRNSFTDEEWEMIVKEVQNYMNNSPLLRTRWEEVKKWYPQKTQDFVDNMMKGDKKR